MIPQLLVLTCTLFGASGMYFLKRGSTDFSLDPRKLLRNWRFLLGGALYAISLVLYVLGLRDLPLNIAYPLTSLTYIWSALLARAYLGERVDAWRWTGIGMIIIGITLVAIA